MNGTARLSRRRIVLMVLAVIVAITLGNCVTGAILNREPAAVEAMQAEAARAAPLIAALARYKAANGLFPPSLTALGERLPQDFLYAGEISDRVLRSEACATQWRDLQGWVMERQDTYQRELDQFAAACVRGLRNYTLQSPDFRIGTHANTERWAFYRSFTGRWVVGWCRHDVGENPPMRTAADGVCRQ